VQATGFIGSKTFNMLASCRVPEGREHEGEMAMDATSVDLIEEAYGIYGGKAEPPPPPPAQSKPRDLLKAHFAQRDCYTEQPADSNCDNRHDGIRTAQDMTAQGSTWLRNEPWCGCWCYYALAEAGVTGMNSWMASVASPSRTGPSEALALQGLDDRPFPGQGRRPGGDRRLRRPRRHGARLLGLEHADLGGQHQRRRPAPSRTAAAPAGAPATHRRCVAMRSSNTPESKAGAADWSKETPSDDLLSPEAKRRIAEVLRELAEIERR
jgi:hypothetical protein